MGALARSIRHPVSLSGVADDDIREIVTSTGYLADELRGARILVTGASGWFGTWLLDALVAIERAGSLGVRIAALCRRPDLFARRHPALHAAQEITWIAGDVRESRLDLEVPITHVVHAATPSSATAAVNPDVLFDTIVGGTRNVFESASRCGARRFLFVSSGAVYGDQAGGVERLAESSFDSARDLHDAYARGKRAAETVLVESARDDGPAVSIARCFAFVGPHMPLDAHFAIGNFIREAVGDVPIRVNSDGRARRSYLYMTDLVVWLLAILAHGRPLRAYNVGGIEAVSIAGLADRCARHAGRGQAGVVVNAAGARGRDYVPDVARAMRELDLRVTVPLDEAIARTTAWAGRSAMPLAELTQ